MFAATHGKTYHSLKYTIYSLSCSPPFYHSSLSFHLSPGSSRAMDLVLNVADYHLLTPYVYPTSWAEEGALRQILSLLVLPGW